MNELPNLPEQGAQAAPASQPVPYVAPTRPGLFETLRQPLPLAVTVLAVLLAAQAWSTHTRINSMRADVARIGQSVRISIRRKIERVGQAFWLGVFALRR